MAESLLGSVDTRGIAGIQSFPCVYRSSGLALPRVGEGMGLHSKGDRPEIRCLVSVASGRRSRTANFACIQQVHTARLSNTREQS
jgi:hypothetical protein